MKDPVEKEETKDNPSIIIPQALKDSEIIYFEVDNWFCGRDYPDAEPFLTWMRNDLNLKLYNSDWAKENELCIYYKIVDMSIDFTVAAKKDWVLKVCPSLFWPDNHKFIHIPEEGETLPEANFGSFRHWGPENFGVEEDPGYNYWDDIDEDEDED